MEAYSMECYKGLVVWSEHLRHIVPLLATQYASLPQHRYLNLANFLVIPMIMDSGVVCPLRIDVKTQYSPSVCSGTLTDASKLIWGLNGF